MTITAKKSGGSMWRMLALACLIPVTIVGVTACSTPQGETNSTQPGGAEGDDTGEENSGDEESLEGLDSAALLELGMTGDAAIKCDFARGDTIGTIYFNGPDQQRFDSLNPDRAEAHIVLHQGQAHTWVHGSSEGVRYPKPDGYPGLVGEDPEDVKAHSSNCAPHSDLSVFELPAGVTFVDLPVE